MKSSNIQYEKVVAYVKAELTGEALQQFEAELANNELLQKEVEFQKSIVNAFQQKRIKAMLDQAKIDNQLENGIEDSEIKMIRDNLQKAKKENQYRRTRVRRLLIAAAAAACLLLAINIPNIKNILQEKPDNGLAQKFNKEKAMQVIQEDPDKVSESLGDGPHHVARPSSIPTETLDEAMTKFKAKDITEAYAILNKMDEQFGEYKKAVLYKKPPVVILYRGLFKAREGKYDESIELLNKIVEDSDYGNQARKYLANVYVIKEEFEKAQEQFDQLNSE